MIMYLVPYHKTLIKSPYSGDEVKKIISELISDESGTNKFLNWFIGKRFEGEVGEESFRIEENQTAFNHFTLIVNGNMKRNQDGVAIECKFKLNTHVWIFFTFLSAVIGLMNAAAYVIYMFTGISKPTFFLIFGMITFLYVFYLLAFQINLYRSKKMLKDLLA
ncbi:hypothetical protein [Marinifilum fragile]|uniref:hypothetical protein n=1 Tax=Marinifilum fragile TaxID=570161 RepID=UPI002AA88F51|nr:hypothetical protein [Marinifilum fragile]